MEARGLGDTSLRYEELGGGWVPSSEGAEVAPAPLQKPAPSSSDKAAGAHLSHPGPRGLFSVSQGLVATAYWYQGGTLESPALNLCPVTHPTTTFLPHPICGVVCALVSQEWWGLPRSSPQANED